MREGARAREDPRDRGVVEEDEERAADEAPVETRCRAEGGDDMPLVESGIRKDESCS